MEHTHHNHETEKYPTEHKMDGHKNHNEHNHHDHHRMMIEDFKKRFWISLILTVPILLLSPMIQNWLGVDWDFNGAMYLLFLLSSIIYFYGGYPFLKGKTFFGNLLP